MPDLDDTDARSARNRGATDRNPPSRRSVLRVAAGAGAAGVAATALGKVAIGVSDRVRPAAAGQQPDEPADAPAARDIVVHVRDASAGEIEVFRGTSAVRLNDRDLAARIVRASR